MSGDRTADYLASLLHELRALPRETEWVEFKGNDAEPRAIGEYISGLANAAALVGKAFAYLVWGVRDDDHAVVGTDFDPRVARVGNEELESWLLRLLEPKLDFRFFVVEIEGRKVVLLEIARAAHRPVRFSGQEYIRVGSYKKKVKDFPEKERALWRIFDQAAFEDGVATERAAADDVLRLLDGGCLKNCVRTIQNRWQSAVNLSVYGELWPSLLLDGCLIERPGQAHYASPPQIATSPGLMPLLDIQEFGCGSKGFSRALSNDTPSNTWRSGWAGWIALLDGCLIGREAA